MPTPANYDPFSKTLHWLMAFLIIGLWCVGLAMDELPKGDLRTQVFGIHKAFGVLVLLLALVRLGWRLGKGTPDLPATMPPLERLGAKLGHVALYVLMIALPVDGVLLSQTGGRAVNVFGVVLPTVIEKNEGLKKAFEEGHEIMAWILAVVVVVHVAAAIRHHLLLKDDVLKRMLPGRA